MSGPRGCFFAPEELGYLFVRAGRRWKLWREREAAVELHHNDEETYSAACWVPPSKNVHKGHCIILGCTSGRLQVWDAASAELLQTAKAFNALASGVACKVSALVTFVKRGTVFAACDGMPDILEVGIMDGLTRSSLKSGKTGVTSLAALSGATSTGEWLVTAAFSAPLKVWRLPAAGADLANLKKATQRLKAPGNNATALDLCSFRSKIYALCADGSTQVEFFQAEESAGQTQPSASQRVLSCHERIEHAWFRKGGGAGDLVAIGYGSTIVAYWTFSVDDATMRTVTPSFTVSKAELNGTIICTRGVGLTTDLVVAHGPVAKPLFSRVSPGKKGTALIESLAPSVGTGKVQKKRAEAPVPSAVPETVSRKKPKVEDAKEKSRPKQPLPKSRSELEGSQLSMAPMIRQHLRSKDKSALDKTLQLKDRMVMDTSVAELSGVEAFDLLHECARRVVDNPGNTAAYCAWIQRIAFHHGTFFRSHPTLAESLRQFYETAQYRCATYRPVRRLHGRIHHLIASGRKMMDSESEGKTKPLLEYTEGDEDLDDDDDDEKEKEDEADDADSGDDEDIDIDFDDAFDDMFDD